MTPSQKLSHGTMFAKLLTRTLRHSSPDEVANAVGKSRQCVSLWTLGKTHPAPRHVRCLIGQLRALCAQKLSERRAKVAASKAARAGAA